jgi:SAM-dependent methyltransferase
MLQATKDQIGVLEDRLMNVMSDYGERHRIDWLTYNPLRMRFFHRYAKRDASAVIASLESVIPEARTYADIGAGSGAYAAEAVRRGHPTVACERSAAGRLIARRQGVESVPFDLTKARPAHLATGSIDLAFSFEVAEHLPPELGERLVEFMCQIDAPTVVFSAAQPGQGGTGHINEQPSAHWAQRFAERGYRLDEPRTSTLRAALRKGDVTSRWLLSNAMVLGRETPS